MISVNALILEICSGKTFLNNFFIFISKLFNWNVWEFNNDFDFTLSNWFTMKLIKFFFKFFKFFQKLFWRKFEFTFREMVSPQIFSKSVSLQIKHYTYLQLHYFTNWDLYFRDLTLYFTAFFWNQRNIVLYFSPFFEIKEI